MLHELKCDTKYFDAVKNGIKTFEARVDDRNFQVGDTLVLRELRPNKYDPSVELTDRQCLVAVTYILSCIHPAVTSGHVIMAISVVKADA